MLFGAQELERLFSGDVDVIRKAIRLEFFDPVGRRDYYYYYYHYYYYYYYYY